VVDPAGPGVLRRWLIEKLGGQAGAGGAVPTPPGAAPPAPQWVASPAPAPPPPPPPAHGVPIMPPMGGPPPPDAAEAEAPGEGKTLYMPGADLGRLRFPTSLYTVQLLDQAGQWRSWANVGANGLNLGRSQTSAHFPVLGSMATRHLRLAFEGGALVAEDLGSLNGIYRRLVEAVELHDGLRFRVGSQVIEFHVAPPFEPAEPLHAEDGEEFFSFDLPAVAYLDLIRPDNRPGLRFPLTKLGVTKLGRDGRLVDIALPRAEWVSSQHAQVRAEGGRFVLEDLNSTNGTFVQLRGRVPLSTGDILLVGRALLRIVDQASG
jgi:pSer/pThr/pTyr-binding forkhead associated (FHA) protein